MKGFEVLQRYVKIADMTDLGYMATEFALEHDFDCLDIVTDEIEKRTMSDKAKVRSEIEETKARVNKEDSDKTKTIKGDTK